MHRSVSASADREGAERDGENAPAARILAVCEGEKRQSHRERRNFSFFINDIRISIVTDGEVSRTFGLAKK